MDAGSIVRRVSSAAKPVADLPPVKQFREEPAFFSQPWSPIRYKPLQERKAPPFKVLVQFSTPREGLTEIFCGEGSQTIKWLSLVASQRYSASLKMDGDAGTTSVAGFDMPLEMRHSDTGELLDPLKRLRDILDSGDMVMLQCVHMNTLKTCEVRTNDFGVPQTVCSKFSREAFFQSSSQQLLKHDNAHDSGVLSCENDYEKGLIQSFDDLGDDEERRIDKLEASKAKLNVHKYEAVIGTASDLSSVIEEARMESTRTVTQTNIGKMVKNPNELIEVTRSIARHAHLLDDVYKFYSGACGGQATDISLAGWYCNK
jgi:hypothetical protein